MLTLFVTYDTGEVETVIVPDDVPLCNLCTQLGAISAEILEYRPAMTLVGK